jgi:P4 family phage/plasmid primase-like protien
MTAYTRTTTKQEILESAQQYLNDFGWIPIPVRTKWETYKKVQTNGESTEHELHRKAPFYKDWPSTTKDNAMNKLEKTARYRDINIGIVAGKPSNIFVIDVDVDNAGREYWGQMLNGRQIETMTQRTPSGGFHLIFTYESRLDRFSSDSRVLRFGKVKDEFYYPGIDFRTNGGQFIVSPSEYEEGQYELDFEKPINPMPDWLFDLLVEHDKNRNPDATAPASVPQPSTNPKKKLSYLKGDDADIVSRLMGLLSVARAENYSQWIKVGLALKSFQHKISFDLWQQFSQKSPKYNESECLGKWNSFNPTRITIGSLHEWAKVDDLDGYNQSIKTVRDHLVTYCDGTHHDCARLFYLMFGPEFKYTPEGWFHFNGLRWCNKMGTSPIYDRLAIDIAKLFEAKKIAFEKEKTDFASELGEDAEANKVIYAKIKEIDEKIKKTKALIGSLKSRNFADNIVKYCQDFLKDPDFELNHTRCIGFNNGVYDLETGEFRAARSSDFVSKTVKYDYKQVPKDDPCYQDLIQILKKIFFYDDLATAEQVMNYILLVLGSSLFGRNKREKFYVWTGCGRNGKGAIITLMMNTLGEYATTLNISALTGKQPAANQPNPALASLKSVLFVVTQEPDNHVTSTRFNTGIIKGITGGDSISTRNNYGPQIEFIPQFIMVLCANKLPEIDGSDQAMFSRTEVTEFINTFVEPDKYNPDNKHEFLIDETIKDKFRRDEYKQAFMTILIESYQRFLKDGITVPAIVRNATVAYQTDNDIIKAFLTDYVEKDAKAVIVLKDLYDCFESSIYFDSSKKMNKVAFKKAIADQLKCPITKDGSLDKKRYTNFWPGFKLKPVDEQVEVEGEGAEKVEVEGEGAEQVVVPNQLAAD